MQRVEKHLHVSPSIPQSDNPKFPLALNRSAAVVRRSGSSTGVNATILPDAPIAKLGHRHYGKAGKDITHAR